MTAKTSHSIIAVCYAYVAGIVLHMLFPIDIPLKAMWIITGIGLLIAGGLIFMILLGNIKKTTLLIPFFLIVFLLFGYTRHFAAVSIPENKILDIKISKVGEVNLKNPIVLEDTSRLKLVKTSKTTSDIVIRLKGELKARVPVLDTNGLARVDKNGKWLFNVIKMPIVSEKINVRADDPIGKIYKIRQPFNSISSIECVSDGGNGSAKISLYKIPNHISSFTKIGRGKSAVTILGRITHDPSVYANRAMISITPDFVQCDKGGPFFKVEGGDVRTLLYPKTENYYKIAKTAAYGYNVQAKGELLTPPGPANPMDFDQRTYMKNHNLFGTLFIDRGMIAPIKLPDGSYASGSPLVEFSLKTRDKMLTIIKQTLPMPHSAFVGAITLGMRYGLASRPGILSDYYSLKKEGLTDAEYYNYDKPHKGWEDTIEIQFKRAGVNHVLAVSGLHVTIITAMFVGIFMLLRIPKKMFVPITIFALVIFAIITGARPSTLRAVIMNSLFLLTWAYMKQGLRSAALFGLALAAVLILIQNPLMIVDPSFTLSFAAILSLVLLTGPAYEMLSKMRGNIFLAFLLFVSITTVIAIRKFALMYTPSFLIFWLLLWTGIFIIAKIIQPKVHPIGDIGFQDLPNGFSTFFAAQFAIQIGMMIPLSSVYFMRWPLGGMYANIIAIPLAGVIIQLGMIAGLLGMIPGIGIYLALLLNAANWISSSAFLLLSHVVARGCPWPFVPKWHPWLVVVYYVYILAFVYRKPLFSFLEKALSYIKLNRPIYARIFAAVLAFLLILPVIAAKNPDKGKLKISVLSVRYGSAIFLQTPNNKNILFDSGAVTFGERGFNNTVRTVLTYLARKGVLRLDAAVLTSPNISRSAGMADVLNEYRVSKLFIPDTITGIKSTMTEAEFKNYILNGKINRDPETTRFSLMYKRLINDPFWPKRLTLAKTFCYHDEGLINKWADMECEVIPLRKGEIIYEETAKNGKKLVIKVLHPDEKIFENKPVDNRAAVIKIQYGDFSFLITSDINYDAQKYIADSLDEQQLKSEIMIVPGHGAEIPPYAFSKLRTSMKNCLNNGLKPLLKKVNPKVIIFEYGDPRPILRETYKDARAAYKITHKFVKKCCPKSRILSTETDQAILITSDGKGYELKTQAELRKDAGKTIGEGSEDIGYAF